MALSKGREHIDVGGAGTAEESPRLQLGFFARTALVALLLVLCGDASARAAQVTEFPLPANDFLPGAITEGADGNLWFANRSGIAGKPITEQVPRDGINRITLSGATTEFPLPEQFGQEVSDIAAGPEGNIWFAERGDEVGYITPSGQYTAFQTALHPVGITRGTEGNLWFTDAGGIPARGEIARITPDGQITSFPLPEAKTFPGAITTGAEGNLWFVAQHEGPLEIGRLTPQGQFSLFELAHSERFISDLTAGPDGNIWFAAVLGTESAVIGRISPIGEIVEYPLPKEKRWPRTIAVGPDGRLWFGYGWAEIGRMTPTGRFSSVSIPRGEVRGLTAGPEGSIWYTAVAEGPCEGGGGGCQLNVPTPGIAGRVALEPLTANIVTRRTRVHGRWVKIELSCGEGVASDVCRGNLRLSVRLRRRPHGKRQQVALGSRHYALPVDTTKKFALRLQSRAAKALAGRRFKADVLARLTGGGVVKGSITVLPSKAHR